MRVSELVDSFIQGAVEGSASNKRLYIEGDKLINYSTVIAYRYKGVIILNGNRYSSTTSRHQNRIRRQLPDVLEVSEEDLTKLINARSHEEHDIFLSLHKTNRNN